MPGQGNGDEGMRRWRQQVQRLKREIYALYLAARDPRVPWYAKVLAVAVVGYALSPLDLIPDFIPVLGLVDDLIVVPLGILLVVRLIPRDIMEDLRARAQETLERGTLMTSRAVRVATGIIVLMWMIVLAVAIYVVLRLLRIV